MDDKLSIHIKIAEREYPLKIERNDEEKIRKAAKTINDRIYQYKQKYANKDIQDLLAMAALQLATKVIEGEMKSVDSSLSDELRDLNEGLVEYIQHHKINVL
jgi:cell division protein ZapA (FtsZ GTPase activity inhibitor)